MKVLGMFRVNCKYEMLYKKGEETTPESSDRIMASMASMASNAWVINPFPMTDTYKCLYSSQMKQYTGTKQTFRDSLLYHLTLPPHTEKSIPAQPKCLHSTVYCSFPTPSAASLKTLDIFVITEELF